MRINASWTTWPTFFRYLCGSRGRCGAADIEARRPDVGARAAGGHRKWSGPAGHGDPSRRNPRLPHHRQ
jgi:hypothetical protein